MKRDTFLLFVLVSTYLGLSNYTALAQNHQKLFVNQHHPKTSDENPGTPDFPFRTISRAAELAQA
jgi:hypothetical protein